MTPGRFSSAVALVVAFGVCLAVIGIGTSQAANDPDPDLQAVCGRCHSLAVFLNQPRSWERWNDVFADMTRRGARGTDAQLARVTAYFLENLTLVNINSSPVEEVAWVLDVRDDVAQEIVVRRQKRPFTGIAELREVAGVDAVKVERRKSRILF